MSYVALLPYLFNAGDKINFAPSDCFLLLAMILGVGQLRHRRQAWSAWHFGIVMTLVIGSLTAALRFGSLERYELINKDLGMFLPLFSYALITSVITEWNDVRAILRVFTMSVVIENLAAIAGFVAAYFFHVKTPFTHYEGLRLSGMLLDPNAYGGLLVVALVIAEAASSGANPLFQGKVLWISRLSLQLGILLTFSRSAWLGLGVALVLLATVRPTLATRTVLGGLITAPCLIILFGSRFVPIVETMASRPKQVQERIDLLHEALQVFVRYPLVGGGLGTFRLTAGVVAHNTALWFLADFGIVGLILLLAFLGWFLVKGWLAFRLAPKPVQALPLALLLANAAMIGVAMGIEAFYQRHWWLIMALTASSYSLTLQPMEQEQCDACSSGLRSPLRNETS